MEVGQYINSGKALVIYRGDILLSVVVAFTAGVIAQYLSRLLFSFDFKTSFKYFGGIWGGFAIASINYFMIVKGANRRFVYERRFVGVFQRTTLGKIIRYKVLSFGV